MAIDVKFDGVSLDPDKITGLTRECKPFTDYFKLGSTSAANYVIEYHDTTLADPSVCTIYDGSTLKATLLIDSIDKSDDTVVIYTFTDGMTKFNFNYSAQSLIEASADGYVTLYDIVDDICTEAGITLATQSFYLDDLRVSWYDSTIQARQYISWVAEVNGGYAQINESGELEFKRYATYSGGIVQTPEDSIAVDTCSSFKLGEQHEITQVSLDLGTAVYTTTGGSDDESVYLDSSNVFIVDGTLDDDSSISIQDIVDNISLYTVGLVFYSVKVDKMPIPEDVFAGGTLEFTYNSASYYTFMNVNQSFNGKWLGGLDMTLGSPEQASTQISGTASQVKRIKTIVDQAEASLSIIAEEVGDNTSNVAGLTVSVNNILASIANQAGGAYIEVVSGGVNVHSTYTLDSSGNPDYSGSGYVNIQSDGMRFYNSSGVLLATALSNVFAVGTFRTGNWEMAQSDESGGYTLDFYWSD